MCISCNWHKLTADRQNWLKCQKVNSLLLQQHLVRLCSTQFFTNFLLVLYFTLQVRLQITNCHLVHSMRPAVLPSKVLSLQLHQPQRPNARHHKYITSILPAIFPGEPGLSSSPCCSPPLVPGFLYGLDLLHVTQRTSKNWRKLKPLTKTTGHIPSSSNTSPPDSWWKGLVPLMPALECH